LAFREKALPLITPHTLVALASLACLLAGAWLGLLLRTGKTQRRHLHLALNLAGLALAILTAILGVPLLPR
jgi:hypothetical protein